jgi:hypothetical protein
MLARGLLLFLALSAVSASDIQFEIFEPQAGQEYAKDQEIVLSFQGTGWPKNDKRADLLLNKKKLRDLPLPKKDGEVFNVTLTGVKKGRHEFEVRGPCTGMLPCTLTPSRNLACLREGYPTLRSFLWLSHSPSPQHRTLIGIPLPNSLPGVGHASLGSKAREKMHCRCSRLPPSEVPQSKHVSTTPQHFVQGHFREASPLAVVPCA